MELSLLTTDGGLFALRWAHFLAGITWIGILYYFNFIQGSFFTEVEADVKKVTVQKLVPRALWWFRWGAMFTIITGLAIIAIRGHQTAGAIYSTSWGVSILTGAAMGVIMWFNVWFVIWPAQKVVIAAANGADAPDAAARGARASVASRTNTLLSIPMLFFMGAASHLPLQITDTSSLSCVAWAVGIVLLIVEGNALKGKNGPMTTVKGVITCGFILTAILYGLIEACL
jgi:uncharacterized membrane protein